MTPWSLTPELISTGHSQFLLPPHHPSQPPRSLILRGVNLSSSSKAPGYQFSTSTSDLDQGELKARVHREERRRRSGAVRSVEGEEQVGFWSEAEKGGREGWFNHSPFPEGEADVHLARLRSWGFTVIRYLVTWEALEHAGPGKYDESYIDHTIRILRKCQEFGFKVYISAHQDVFSRFCSGTGAPYWVMEAVGLNPRRIHQTGAAVIHSAWATGGAGGEEGMKDAKAGTAGDWPDMIWNTNTGRLAARHCFTMFWASDEFAPKCLIDGVPASTWLQGRYNAAYGHLADRLRDAGDLLDVCLIGWDSMNEPDAGFIGIPDLGVIPESQDFKKGPTPSPIQGFLLGNGQRVENIEVHDFGSFGPKKTGKLTLTPPGGKSVWLTRDEARKAEQRWGWKWGNEWNFWDEQGGGGCIWAGHDVWDPKTGTVVHPDYFASKAKSGDESDEFIGKFWLRHYTSYLTRVREAHPNAIAFINPPVFEQPPPISDDIKKGRVALSAHYYDGMTMIDKRRHVYNADAVGVQRGLKSLVSALRFGEQSIKNNMREQIQELKSDAHKQESIADKHPSGKYPTMIGEIGVPFDMRETALFGLARGKETDRDYTEVSKAMHQVLNACDGNNALSYTIWAYESNNNHAHGDNWNGEDLSLFSYDDIDGDDDFKAFAPKDLASLTLLGARGIESWCRPYPVEVVGETKYFTFDYLTGDFELEIVISKREDRVRVMEEVSQKGKDEGHVVGSVAQADPSSSSSSNNNVGTGNRTSGLKLDLGQNQGYAIIYAPYVHYRLTRPPAPGNKDSIPLDRLIGRAVPGENWTAEDPMPRVDLKVDVSHGTVEAEGQWVRWVYPLTPEGGDYKLKFGKWTI